MDFLKQRLEELRARGMIDAAMADSLLGGSLAPGSPQGARAVAVARGPASTATAISRQGLVVAEAGPGESVERFSPGWPEPRTTGPSPTPP